ncbi:MAG: hypothetical protein JWM80_6099 [Cyanobacteria bacterium RYN_339]|nr:hypothetical protein [Cyanobacteria bacterium RYN_339]
MTLSRSLSLLFLVGTLVGCATPPGMPTPLPTDYNEQNKSTDIFRRIAPALGREPDVLGVYLTANNNPRHMKVIVRDLAGRSRMLAKYGGTIDGLDVMYRADYEPNPGDEALVPVPKEELPTTWWEKMIAAFAAWKNRLLAPATPQSPVPTGDIKHL